MNIHNLQAISISAATHIRAACDLLPNCAYTFSWCPGHSGVSENEMADQLANTKNLPPPAPFMSMNAAIRVDERSEELRWNKLVRGNFGMGSQFIAIRHRGKAKQGTYFIAKCNNNIALLSRITRSITGHMPTGEYRQHFHPDTDTRCLFDDEFHSRAHVLCRCPQYSHTLKSFDRLARYKNTIRAIVKLFEKNRTLGTFEDVPEDHG